MATVKWVRVKFEDIEPFTTIRARSSSKFTPATMLEGWVFQSTSGLRLDIDLAEPQLDMLHSRKYKFYRKVSE